MTARITTQQYNRTAPAPAGISILRHSLIYAFALIFIIINSASCTSARRADLQDCISFSMGIGVGLDATAKLGCLLHPSIGLGSVTGRSGLENRKVNGSWYETQAVWPVSMFMNSNNGIFGTATRPFYSYGRDYSGDYFSSFFETTWIPALKQEKHPPAFSFHELTDIQAGVTLGVVSVRAGINPLEFVDFLLGFAGIDIAGDDPKKQKNPTKEQSDR